MSEDKNEEPTQKKIDDAREKGQIAVSRDLAKLATLVAVAETAFATESLWRGVLFNLFNTSILDVNRDFSLSMAQMMTSAGVFLVIVFFVCFLICILTAVAGHWGQFGVLIAPEAITPKFDKLNPVNGLKQLFSKKKVVELLTTVSKALLIGGIVYSLIRSHLGTIIALSNGEPKDSFEVFLALLRSIFHVIVVVCLLLGIIDYAIQHHFHKKELMMDQEEIKKEHKESEGDPLIKNQRKRLARQWANESPEAKTEDANAVVTNPTHFAIALYYDADELMVPVVLAKGKDEVAQAMIRRARACGIPVIRHVWLARTLYASCRPDTVIPKASYEAVAQVYAVVHELMATHQLDKEVELEMFGEAPNGTPPVG
ncbi:type III secretion system export apparatus subunit SctU [Herbaspirillum sp. RV1423]|uniref:type III secretion system export apparatus subunit SctU n=1 Tax=Herbaspirillum sp. RV1423 TaxID=1443993 RepID=UPI0004ACEE99|nr:type III secretion system export apparatus subunit SctU [Herbaspirillum sp. RV1423]